MYLGQQRTFDWRGRDHWALSNWTKSSFADGNGGKKTKLVAHVLSITQTQCITHFCKLKIYLYDRLQNPWFYRQPTGTWRGEPFDQVSKAAPFGNEQCLVLRVIITYVDSYVWCMCTWKSPVCSLYMLLLTTVSEKAPCFNRLITRARERGLSCALHRIQHGAQQSMVVEWRRSYGLKKLANVLKTTYKGIFLFSRGESRLKSEARSLSARFSCHRKQRQKNFQRAQIRSIWSALSFFIISRA